jgi:hypothetical protein
MRPAVSFIAMSPHQAQRLAASEHVLAVAGLEAVAHGEEPLRPESLLDADAAVGANGDRLREVDLVRRQEEMDDADALRQRGDLVAFDLRLDLREREAAPAS